MNRTLFARAIVLSAALAAVPALHAHAQATSPAAVTASADSIATVDVTELYGRPDIINRGPIARAISQAWVNAGSTPGVVMLFYLIDERGVPRTVAVTESSGNAALDRAALGVGRRMRFSPSTLDGKPVRVQLQMPLTFGNPRP